MQPAATKGLVFFDADLRRTHGTPCAAELLDGADDAWVRERLRDVLRTGQPVLDARADRLQAAFFPLAGADGRIAGVGVSVEDRTERARAENSLRLLAETGAVLEASQLANERLEQIARLLVGSFADACVAELVERSRRRTVAIAHRDAAAAMALPAGVGDPGERRIDAPLMARGRLLGLLTLSRTSDHPPFDAADVAFVEDVVARAALAVDNALLLEQQTEIARTLQHSLLPPHLPAIPGIELAARYRAAGVGVEVGGDFYDAFPTRGGWTITIGDACGKGPQAAGVTALARHTIRALAFAATTPGDVLRGVNDRLARQPDGEALLTAALVKLETRDDAVHVTVACAGHPPPLLVRATGEVEEVGLPGTLLGPFARDAVFEDVSAELHPGDALVLYTDGITEARQNGRIFGEARLRDVLAGRAGEAAPALADAVERAVEHFGGTPSDDMALLVAAAT